MELIENEYGYLQIKNIPSDEDLKRHYEEKYYQENSGAYESFYTEDEIKWRIFQEWIVVRGLLKINAKGRVVDIGCGEGFFLKVLAENGFDACGVDFSSHGITKENPNLLDIFEKQDIYEFIKQTDKLAQFDVISLLHVIEHVRDPENLLRSIREVMRENSVLVIRFPNDNSKLHEYISKKTNTKKNWWYASPEHITYFNHDSMLKFLKALGFDVLCKVADHPIDFNLLNTNSNYINDRSKGKATHTYRVLLDNFLSELDKEKYFRYWKCTQIWALAVV